MNRSVAAVVFSLLFAASLTAAETRRFIVATNHPFAGGKLIAALQDSGAEFTPRGVLGFQVIDGFAADLTDDEAASLRKSPQVRYVVETVTYRAMGLETNDTSQIVPYGIDLVHARDAWAAGRLGGTINVVVIDTGVDYRHPELAAIFQGGKDLVNKDDDPLDDQGHGTHVSGTIAAADNTVGVVGIAPQVRLWSAKVLGPDGSGTNDNAIAALDWIIAKKEQLGGNWILNLSLGSSDSDPATAEAFQKAVDAGLFIVAASGNESIAGLPAPVSYPAAYPGVIAVGAIDQQFVLANFSNKGPQLSLVAPGVDVLSTARLGTGSIQYVLSPQRNYFGADVTGAKRGVVTAQFVNCGVGREQDFPASVAGKIALIARDGVISFADKADRALRAGAIGVAIFNNTSAPTFMNWTLNPATATPRADWPVTVALSQADGQALLAQTGATITVGNETSDYAVHSGTSMACPHVVGVAALVWSIAPSATPAQLRTALEQTAHDLGTGGRDVAYGFGVVDAFAAAKQLNPAAFGNGGTPGTVSTGRKILRRGGK